MHYDYSLGALPAMPAMPGPEAAAFSLFIPQMQDGIAKKLTSRQIYNSIRFNDPNIAGANLTRRMKLKSPPLGYEIGFFGMREAFKRAFKPKTNHDLNVKLSRAFNAALAVVRLIPLPGGAPPPPPPPDDLLPIDDDEGGSADTQSATPSAFPIVPVAIAAVGLVAVLLMRKK